MEGKSMVKVEDIKSAAEERRCPVQMALYYVEEFLKGPMCGRCYPCALGTYEAKVRLLNITEGEGDEEDFSALKDIAGNMLLSSFCKKGKDTAKFLLEWMDRGLSQEHFDDKCHELECPAFVEYRVIPEKCILCGLCKDECRYNAIIGEKSARFKTGYLPYEIRDRRCTYCGDCVDVCPTGAIVVIQRKTAEVLKGEEEAAAR